MLIDEMTYADLINVQQLNLRNLPENYTMQYYIHHLVHNPHINFVCRIGDTTVAYILGKEELSDTYYGHIASLCVDFEHRKKGIASLLIDKLIECFKNRKNETGQNVYEVNLKVRVSNVVAIKLYEKKGFRVSEVEEKYYGDGEAANSMILKIQ